MPKRRKTAPHQKLAASLAMLKNVQADGRRVFQSAEFSRNDRERLIKQGFLREVIKGWLISSAPGTTKGDSTPSTFYSRRCVDPDSRILFLPASGRSAGCLGRDQGFFRSLASPARRRTFRYRRPVGWRVSPHWPCRDR